MGVFKVGIVGSGNRGKAHARAYAFSDEVDVVACSDIDREKALDLAGEQKIPRSKAYRDHKRMLAREEPDIVSICTWPGSHAQIVLDCVEGSVKAIFLEKPMAPTWGESKRIYHACEDGGVIFAVCHQRRFAPSFIKAKELANDGTIGELHRVEGYCPNLFDWGTHWFDMFFFYNNDEPAEWVMGQINWESKESSSVFGVPIETHGLSYIKWKNGVYGLMATGNDNGGRCANRLIGTKGIIELDVFWEHKIWGEKKSGPLVRVLREGAISWEKPQLRYPSGDRYPYKRSEQMEDILAVLNLIDCLKTGREPVLSGRKALQATELIFATYESSRRHARIYLPLDIEDSPFFSMLEAGTIGTRVRKARNK